MYKNLLLSPGLSVRHDLVGHLSAHFGSFLVWHESIGFLWYVMASQLRLSEERLWPWWPLRLFVVYLLHWAMSSITSTVSCGAFAVLDFKSPSGKSWYFANRHLVFHFQLEAFRKNFAFVAPFPFH